MYFENFQQIFNKLNWPREKLVILLVPLSNATKEKNKQEKLLNYAKHLKFWNV